MATLSHAGQCNDSINFRNIVFLRNKDLRVYIYIYSVRFTSDWEIVILQKYTMIHDANLQNNYTFFPDDNKDTH